MAAFRAVANVPEDGVPAEGMEIIKYENDDTNAQQLAKVIIPSTTATSAALEAGDKVAVSVIPAPVPNGFTLSDDQAAFNYDVKLVKVDSNNAETPIASPGKPVTVELTVGKGLSGVKIFHTSGGITTEVSGVSYDPSTGIATFKTESFSDYTVVYRTKEVTGDIVVTVDGEPNR